MPAKTLKDPLSPADRAELEALEAARLADEAAKAAAAASLPILGSLPDGGMFRLRVASRVLEMPSYLDTDDFEILKARIAEHGVIDPVVCHATEEIDEQTGYPWLSIINGRHRFEAVRRLILETASPIIIPCALSEVSIDDAVVDTLLGRRNTDSPGIRAYLVWPYLAPKLEAEAAAGAERKKKTLKQGSRHSHGANDGETDAPAETPAYVGVRDLARRYGFSVDVLYRARNIYVRYAERPDLKAQFEPRILSAELSLEAAYKGMGGKIGTERSEEDIEQDAKKRKTPSPSLLITRSITDWGNRLAPKVWETIDEKERPALSAAIIDGVLKWPAEITQQLVAALSLKGGQS